MRGKDTFAAYHPLVNFIYFALVLGFTMFFMQPVCLAVSLFSALCCHSLLSGRRAARLALSGMLPLLLLTALISPLFSHAGATVLWYFPSGNPLTLESIFYGVCAACMLAAAILWFACYMQVMTSDKFIYLFGRVIPSLSLFLSMTLRFVPRFRAQFRAVDEARRSLDPAEDCGVWQRIKRAAGVFSAVVTWALENGVETADSMRSRGYGLPGRTSFALYRISTRDTLALLWLALCGILIAVCGAMGMFSWHFFPTWRGGSLTPLSLGAYLLFAALCLTPVFLDRREERRWKHLRSEM